MLCSILLKIIRSIRTSNSLYKRLSASNLFKRLEPLVIGIITVLVVFRINTVLVVLVFPKDAAILGVEAVGAVCVLCDSTNCSLSLKALVGDEW